MTADAPRSAAPNGPQAPGSSSGPRAPGGPPPEPPRAPRRWPGTRRHRLIALAAGACVVLAGAAWWLWPRPDGGPPLHVAAGTVQADLLTPDQAARLAGTTLAAGPRSDRPPDPVAATPADCAAAVGPATASVYGHMWTAFLSATYGDSAGRGTYTVSQAVGVYPDTARAAAAFRTLSTGLTRCPAATRTDGSGRGTAWAYQLAGSDPDALGWTATQDSGGGWACYHRARLKGTGLLQVAVCEAGDGAPAADRIARSLAGRVTG